MLLGKTDLDIMDDLTSAYRPETAKRFLTSAKIQYEKIRREAPEEFSEYLLLNAKNVTPSKKKLPKTRKALPSNQRASTHVNADGSIVEMKEVLEKEEEIIQN